MKCFVPRLLVVYGVSLSLLFGVALIPDYAALIQAVEQPEFLEVDELDDTERGEGGFGHTGR